MILAGDIGGTKTHLALFENGNCVHEKKFASQEYAGLLQVVEEFLSLHPASIERACFGVAGPVVNGVSQTTNLPWKIDAVELAKGLKISQVFLINDLEAHAWGIRSLKPTQVLTLNEGNSAVLGNQALIAAGTGLGEAGLYWNGKTHLPFACEGGHADFAAQTELEMELLRYFKNIFEHVSYERVLSGAGLYHLYRFLIDMRLENEGEEFEEIAMSHDPAKVISEKALSKESRACMRALDWFVSLYGAEAGNLALKFLALGGLYIGGGIAPKILPAMQSGGFMKAFTAKGRFSSLLSAVPVRIILDDNTALLGAANYTLHVATDPTLR
jgi:glucokinase